jgi:hypothetical protein
MPRYRTIKPEFWSDERVGECSQTARLLFIGCLNFADDNGNLPRSAKQLKAQVFPYDDLNCEPNVQELLTNDLIAEYEVTGVKYLRIKNFLKHQKIDKPSKCTIPRPLLDADSTSTTRARAPEGNRKEGNREERKREEGKEGMGSSVPDSKADQSELVDEIGHLYPGNRTLAGKGLPQAHQVAILEAVTADGDKVLNGTKAFAAAVAKWPAHRRQFIPSADKWYREAKYLTNPAEWADVKPGETPVIRFPAQSGLDAHERMMRDLMEPD